MDHEKVQDLLGEPIKSYGVATRRHKSKQVKHMYYTDESGKKGLRIQFDLIGVRRQAVVELDAREVSLSRNSCLFWHLQCTA